MTPSPTGRVSRRLVETALHKGMADAVRDYAAWTGGETLTDWAAEGVLTTYCARALTKAIDRSEAKAFLTMEQRFSEILTWSERHGRPGRRFKAEIELLSRPSRRVDLLLWNAKATPRAIIEVKRNAGIRGLIADAGRLCQFARYAGRAYSGSLRYGMLAATARHSAGSSAEAIARFHERRKQELSTVAAEHDMVLRISKPRNVPAKGMHVPCVIQTVIYVFRPTRPGRAGR